MSAPRPELAALRLADPPGRWLALGFEVRDAVALVGGIALRFGVPGDGITGWSLRGVQTESIDGLPTCPVASDAPRPAAQTHPNGAIAIDHVVVATPDFDRTAAALQRCGMPLRRIREHDRFRQGFRRLGPAILELVSAGDRGEGPARFWGLVVVVEDLDGLAAQLGERLGPIKDAVQPGRRIATLGDSAGLGAKVAFMDPEGDERARVSSRPG